MLRRAAREAAERHLPGAGWCFFDVRHEFPDAWQMLRNSAETDRGAKLPLRMHRKLFPFIPGANDLWITSVAILFEARECDELDRRPGQREDHYKEDHYKNDPCNPVADHCCDNSCAGECPCPRKAKPASRILEFRSRPCHDKPVHLSCLASEEWPELYYGMVDTEVGRLERNGHGPELEFRFPPEIGKVERAYLLCQYRRSERHC